jgi:hypothetical protein
MAKNNANRIAHESAGGGGEQEEEQIVFQRLSAMVLIGRGFAGGGFSPFAEKTHQVMQCAERANPAAKESSEKNGQNKSEQPPQETRVDRPGGEQSAEGNQGIELKKPVHGPATQLPPFHTEGTDDAEPQKEQQKKGLTYPSNRYDVHGGLLQFIGYPA